MKTQSTFTRKRSLNTIGFLTILIIAFLAFNPMYGQSENSTTTEVSQDGRTIKGLIMNEEGPLEGTNIVLKGSNYGTVANSKGEFTFPKKLKTGDVLLISYLGFQTVEFSIKDDTTFIRLMLTEDVLEFIGALNSDKPYKSKRNKN